MSIKISENADPKLLKPGAEVTFDKNSEIVPIPVPTPPLVLGQKSASAASHQLEKYLKGITHCEEMTALFEDDLEQLESTLNLIRKHITELAKHTGYEDLS